VPSDDPRDDIPSAEGPEDYGLAEDAGRGTDIDPNGLSRIACRSTRQGLFSGEGGTGKSIIELMKNVAHVTGKDWLGSMPELGPAIYLPRSRGRQGRDSHPM
jgi:hypothetical protein